MRSDTALLLPLKHKFKQINLMPRPWGTVATSTPRKQWKKYNNTDEKRLIAEENNDPIVAFSRPQPKPPFLAPLVAFFLFDTWSSREDEEEK